MGASSAFTTVPYQSQAGRWADLEADGGRVFVTRSDATKAVAVCLSLNEDIHDAIPAAALPGLLGVPFDDVLAVVAEVAPKDAEAGMFARLSESEAATVACRFGAALFCLGFNRKERGRVLRQIHPQVMGYIHEVYGLAPDPVCTVGHHQGRTPHLTDFERQQLAAAAPLFGNPTDAHVVPLVGLTRWHLANVSLTVGDHFQPQPDVQMRTLGSSRQIAEAIVSADTLTGRTIRLHFDGMLAAEALYFIKSSAPNVAGALVAAVMRDGDAFFENIIETRDWLPGAEGVKQVEKSAQEYFDEPITLTVVRAEHQAATDNMLAIVDKAFQLLGDDLWRAHQSLPLFEVRRVLGDDVPAENDDVPNVPMIYTALALAATLTVPTMTTFVTDLPELPHNSQGARPGWALSTAPGHGPRYAFNCPPAKDPAAEFANLDDLPAGTLTPLAAAPGGEFVEVTAPDGPITLTLADSSRFTKDDLATLAGHVRGPIPAAEFGMWWVDTPVVEAMAETASRPVWLNLDELPSQAGIAWFGSELVLSEAGTTEKVAGFSWVRRSQHELALIMLGGVTDDLHAGWATAEVWVNPDTGDAEVSCTTGSGRLAAALFNLLNLPRTVETSTATLTSETRDWNAKRTRKVTKTRIDRIKVATLRVGADHAKARQGGNSWHYKHRFWVSGHLRFQPYRSQTDKNGQPKIERIWIDGYVKGPDGAPWLPKRDKVILLKMARPDSRAA